LPREERIANPVPTDVIDRLSKLPEFVKAFHPDGMNPNEFITYGVVQKTLTQFHDNGWKRLENF